jgi:hypothetical protein
MTDSPSGPAGDMAQPSVESARVTAFKALARQTVEGGLTLGDYAEHAVAIQQAVTTDEIDAIQRAPAAGAPAARRPGWLISVFTATPALVSLNPKARPSAQIVRRTGTEHLVIRIELERNR